MAQPSKVLAFPKSKTVNESFAEALDFLITNRLSNFADHLATARELYKRHPELVTATEFPLHLRDADDAHPVEVAFLGGVPAQ